MTDTKISSDVIGSENDKRAGALKTDYQALGEKLARSNIDIEAITSKVAEFHVAVPSWGVGTGGTRFARFPGLGEPRNIFDKLDDCAVIHQLTRATPTVSLHIPWDKADPKELKAKGDALGLGFDAMNSNTFSDAPDQAIPTNMARSAMSMPALGPRPSNTISNASRSVRRLGPRR